MNGDRNPQLDWNEAGEPRSGRFGDVYFSREDGLAESRAVFLQGCGLPDAWVGRQRFVVGELGFGTGLNIAALLHLWRRAGPAQGRLQIFSVEGFPMMRDEAARALAHWPEISEESHALLEVWPSLTPGFHRLDWPHWRATLDLAVGEVDWALDQWLGRADAWFLDGFSPAINPDMWSSAVLERIAARSTSGARLASFTVAGAVRRSLVEQGFMVEKKPGHGRKRERLEARRNGRHAERSPTVAVIGAGIAGASLARAFDALGARVTVVEGDRPGAGASGFPAALVTPRLDVGDTEIAALYARALDRAHALYGASPGAVIAKGVVQLERAPRDAVRFDKISAQPIWPKGALTRLDALSAAARLGEASAPGALTFEQALTVNPRAILEAWLRSADLVRGLVERIELTPGGWALVDAQGHRLATAEIVVLAAGWGAASLFPDLPLSPVAGQADWITGVASPAIAWGGYAAPTAEGGLLYGATHDRGVTSGGVTSGASQANRAALEAMLPNLAARLQGKPAQARAAIRATTPDRLPLAGAAPGAPGLFVLGGLGSRGFCVAPLLAEHVAAIATGGPSPLPLALARRVDVKRGGGRCNDPLSPGF